MKINSEQGWVPWCSGSHVCFTRRRSWDRTPAEPNFTSFFFAGQSEEVKINLVKSTLREDHIFEGCFLIKDGLDKKPLL